MDRLGGFFGPGDAEDHLDEDFVGEDDADLEPPPPCVGQDERRMQVRAYNHWASLLGDLNFPNIADLEPERLDDFGPHSVLLDFSAGVEDPQIAFIGAELAAECRPAGALRTLSDVPGRSVLSRITDHYMQILANQAPIGFEAEFVNDQAVAVLYRGILLPYSSDNESIDFILGVINWKEMADQRTADALLLEIDQALAAPGDEGRETAWPALETAEMLAGSLPVGDSHGESRSGGDILELGNEDMMDHSPPHSLPLPAFGLSGNEEDEDEEQANRVPAPRSGRSVDALGNPIGGLASSEAAEGEEDFDGTIKTAADYGLPDWDEEEDAEEDDVDGVVDPLADEETSSSLISLVSRGNRAKKSVDLSRSEPAAPIPRAYEGENGSPAFDAANSLAPSPASGEDFDDSGDGADGLGYEGADDPLAWADEPDVPTGGPAEDGADPAESGGDVVEHETDPAEGLYDCLAAAREMALTASSTEDRSRKALYAAVGRAYDFSLEARAKPADYDELLVENGLSVQDRAPMTPVVKLVFGADYDKTRLTEYAAVLMHAHRVGIERGSLSAFLRDADGGLKGVVQAERRARKEEQGKPLAEDKTIRPALAAKLRQLEPLPFDELEGEGAEFALVMIRRTPEGEVQILGELPEDVGLIERTARKLLD